ncbi:WXG100 family type VII secretion target [Actinophytocola xanthii]|uniref:Uncharacterized protein n=1 Tax=Actinophytocola xanthii TaxID=1912961 RepID=A0A1Q8CY73_9PSEU|nr:WXG100 family type VII secretion target [Actinophytocola xanthii]OLF19303.1 hypothetical protein BU204_02860 [Actinophytocola xanthii]
MPQYTSATALIGGDPAQLAATADVLARSAESVDGLATALRRSAEGTDATWRGPAGTAYRARAGRQVGTLGKLPTSLSTAATAYRTLSAELSSAQQRSAAALRRAESMGLPQEALFGNPFAVARFVVASPDKAGAVAELIGEVVSARSDANEGRNQFVASMGTLQTQTIAAGTGGDDDRNAGGDRDRRGSDGDWGARLRTDDLFGREEGGSRGNSHFDSDWAGRAILDRYLSGGGDWTIDDDEDWTRYMTSNEQLSRQLVGPAQEQAQQALSGYLAGDGPTGSFDQRFPAEIQNGEGIVGYEYLHGTNSDAGGFQFAGNTTVSPRADGTYEVTIDGSYTWHDTIDPNPQYSTDRWKSGLAEVVTLGAADPYDIHINWDKRTTVTLDAQGNVLSISGYPAP